MQQREPTFSYDGYQISVRLAHMTGGGEDTFDRIAKDHIELLREYIGLYPDQKILEVGCGIGRDAIPLTGILSKRGAYVGIDIVKSMIEWDQLNITARNPNFQFYLFDVREPYQNPHGERQLQEFGLPCADG